jgi:hypothetical protein
MLESKVSFSKIVFVLVQCLLPWVPVWGSSAGIRWPSVQGCGSGSGLDPDSIGSVDPAPDPGGQKLPTKVEKICKSLCFKVLDGIFWELKASSVTWTYCMEA